MIFYKLNFGESMSSKSRISPKSARMSTVKNNSSNHSVKNTNSKPGKYNEMAKNLYEKCGYSIGGRSSNRLEKITNFLRTNRLNSNRALLTRDFNLVEKAKKSQFIGRTNKGATNLESYKLWIVIPN